MCNGKPGSEHSPYAGLGAHCDDHTHDGYTWCYVDAGTCADEKPSNYKTVPPKMWSKLACPQKEKKKEDSGQHPLDSGDELKPDASTRIDKLHIEHPFFNKGRGSKKLLGKLKPQS